MFERADIFVFGVGFFCLFLTILASAAMAQTKNEVSVSMQAVEPAKSPEQKIIAELFEAVRVRDAARAYDSTTNHMHEKFKTARDFLKKMRYEFRPLYNHEAYNFLDSRETENGIVQKVRVNDRYGESVIMIYRLEKQDSGELLIDSFTMIGGDARPI